MNSKSLKASLNGLLSGAVYGVLISVLPVLLIKHRKPFEFFTDQPTERWGFYCIVLIVCAALFAKTFVSQTFLQTHPIAPSSNEIEQTSETEANVVVQKPIHPVFAFIKKYGSKYGFELTATAFLFWYTACAALCEKLRIFTLPDALVHLEYIVGLIFVALAAVVFLRSVFVQDTVPDTKQSSWAVAHPIYAATLVYTIGVPFLFQTWFPLIAIPGAIVCLKWQLGTKNGIESGTGSGTIYKWQIVPFLY